MHERQRIGDTIDNLQRTSNRDSPASHQLLQVRARHILEDDERDTAVLTAVENRDNVRMCEGCRCRGLTPKSVGLPGVACKPGIHYLERHLPLENEISRKKNARHTARADELTQLVSAT